MPELPEVETIRQKLIPRISGKVLLKLETRRPDLRFPIPKSIKNLKGQTLTKIERRSKYLILVFNDSTCLLVHLGMTGRLYFCDSNRELNKHDHVLFDFEEGLHLRFQDPRRFGFMDICRLKDLSQNKFLQNLGREPLSKEFSGEWFYESTKKSKSPIKNFIMNAHQVVGVGNIYANEALFLAGIHPERQACSLSKSEVTGLVVSIKSVLKKSLEMGGTSFRDYVNVDEKPGLHKINLKVYQRSNESCFVCGQTIQTLVQSGRSTFFCMNCQK